MSGEELKSVFDQLQNVEKPSKDQLFLTAGYLLGLAMKIKEGGDTDADMENHVAMLVKASQYVRWCAEDHEVQP